MSDTDRRKKMISLRLSEVEYDVLKAHYRTCGARNVSDLARLALQRMMNGPVAPLDVLAAKLAELENRVHILEAYVSLTGEGELVKSSFKIQDRRPVGK